MEPLLSVNIPSDPIWPETLNEYGIRLRNGTITAVEVTKDYLQRIEQFNPKLKAFVHVANESAIEAAREVDNLLRVGTDLGPLMGVPISVKELFKVEGMPAGAGSAIDVSEYIGDEGCFIRRLKQAGCIILGTTRSTEFAFSTFNFNQHQPWNPRDKDIHRITGGSSQGAAVAQAAGLCAISIGTDTGGSVRVPASLCGLFGYLPSHHLFPRDGLFSLLPESDTIGFLANSAIDAQLMYSVLETKSIDENIILNELTFGKPGNHFYDHLEPEVLQRVNVALELLKDSGINLVPVEVPDPQDELSSFGKLNHDYPKLFKAQLKSMFGENKLNQLLPSMNENTRIGLQQIEDLSAGELSHLKKQLAKFRDFSQSLMDNIDGWLVPSLPMTAIPMSEIDTMAKAMALQVRAGRNMSMINKLRFIAVTIPIPGIEGELPVGLQLIMPNGQDKRLLATACSVEKQIVKLSNFDD